MSHRPYQQIQRRRSRQIRVGKVLVGGDAPITVQTMTNTPTTDVAATVAQIRRAEIAGVDIVRVSCPDQESALVKADQLVSVQGSLLVQGCSLPMVALKIGIVAKKARCLCSAAPRKLLDRRLVKRLQLGKIGSFCADCGL